MTTETLTLEQINNMTVEEANAYSKKLLKKAAKRIALTAVVVTAVAVGTNLLLNKFASDEDETTED